jgi:signal transduction histidine kinase
MNRTLSNITTGIKGLASNEYTPMKEKGMYKDVLYSLNLLDSKLKASEEERRRNQTLREEWIANISHDLKTPLSPIKGYAEILTDSKYDVSLLDVKKYGEVILRNAENVEDIVENLNFTYQLKNGMLPINRSDENLVRLLKEVIINILNHPKYEERNIIFNCTEDRINFNFDNTLLRRAFTNLLYNSVIHNAPDTIIKVSVRQEDKIYITIEDNGKGMSEEEVKKLFERYYRGTKSSVSVKGSGLGMAIAKQIIEVHEGKINVKSKLNVGTSIEIEFPKET